MNIFVARFARWTRHRCNVVIGSRGLRGRAFGKASPGQGRGGLRKHPRSKGESKVECRVGDDPRGRGGGGQGGGRAGRGRGSAGRGQERES